MSKGIEGKFSRTSLLKFILPTIIMMVFTSLYTIIDGIFVSRLVGGEALAALNIVLPVPSVIWAISIMFATGGSAIIAKHLGEGKEGKAKGEFSFIILVNLVIGAILAIVMIFFLNDISTFLGGRGKVLEYCNEYLFVVVLVMPITFIKMIFDYFYVVIGKPKIGVILAFIGGITNIILDYLFIGTMNMGISGAALATAIGQIIPAVIGVFVFFNKKNSLHFVKPVYDFKMLLESSLNGASEMIINISGAITVFLFNMVMLKYLGDEGVAAITIVLYAQYLLISIYLGVSSGTAPIISYKYGNDDREQLRKVIRYSFEFIILSSVFVFILSYIISPQIIGAFVKPGSNIYLITKDGFGLFSISFLFIGTNIYTSGMFTAFSNGKVSAIISFLRTFVFIIIGVIVLPIFLDIDGIWLTLPFAEVLTIIFSTYYINKYKKTYYLTTK